MQYSFVMRWQTNFPAMYHVSDIMYMYTRIRPAQIMYMYIMSLFIV